MPSFFQLVLPGCQPLRVALSHDTPLSKFIDIALNNRKWFPIADITTTSCGSLVVDEKWKEWTLDQCGVGNGDTVVLKPGVPDSIHASLFCPEHFEAILTNIVELGSDDWNWESIQNRIRQKWRVRKMFECMQRTSVMSFFIRSNFLPLPFRALDRNSALQNSLIRLLSSTTIWLYFS